VVPLFLGASLRMSRRLANARHLYELRRTRQNLDRTARPQLHRLLEGCAQAVASPNSRILRAVA
jgi:hypothetical protein